MSIRPSTSPRSHGDVREETDHGKRVFHLGMILPITGENHSDFFLKAVEALSELGIKISALAEGDMESQKHCFELTKKYPNNFLLLESIPRNRQEILKNSDAVIFPAAPSRKLLEEVTEMGIVPILPPQKGLKDFDPQEETGNAFTFEEGNFWKFLSAILRASENFKFEYDWENLRKSVKEMKF